MKKILIVQTDSPSFLYPTLRVIEKFFSGVPDTEITLLANATSFATIKDSFPDSEINIVSNALEVQQSKYDVAVNLSLIESSWKLLGDIKTKKRLGIYYQDEQVRVSDHWSTYLLTLKSDVPFLSFHLEEIYKNILGAHQAPDLKDREFQLKKIIFALSDPALFPAGEQEALLNILVKRFPNIPILDITEAHSADTDGVLYIGPPGPEVMAANYPLNLILQRSFQGANLIPTQHSWILSSPDKMFSAKDVFEVLEKQFAEGISSQQKVNLYRSRYDTEGDSFIEQMGGTEVTYPFYLAYFVLWNFVLGLKEFEPPFPKLDPHQKDFLRAHLEVLKKISRFHSFSLASLDILLNEAKSATPDTETIDGHLVNLREIDETLRKISDSHAMLRPLLDFYHIRRGQNEGGSFREQVENSLLTYHEEHQAFSAFQELLEALERR